MGIREALEMKENVKILPPLQRWSARRKVELILGWGGEVFFFHFRVEILGLAWLDCPWVPVWAQLSEATNQAVKLKLNNPYQSGVPRFADLDLDLISPISKKINYVLK